MQETFSKPGVRHPPLNSTQERPADLCGFETNLIHIVSFRTELHSETPSQRETERKRLIFRKMLSLDEVTQESPRTPRKVTESIWLRAECIQCLRCWAITERVSEWASERALPTPSCIAWKTWPPGSYSKDVKIPWAIASSPSLLPCYGSSELLVSICISFA